MAPIAFSHDPTRVMHVVILSVFSFLALVAVIFRLWARKILHNTWEANDYLIIVGLVGVAPANPRRSSNKTFQIWALALSIFTMHCKHSPWLLCMSQYYTLILI